MLRYWSLVVLTLAGVAGSATAQQIDHDSAQKVMGSTQANGDYSIDQDGNNVKITLNLKVKKTGIAGDGKGVLGFALVDGNGNNILRHDLGLTVGANALTGVNEKNETQTITILGNKWNDVVGIAFYVNVDSNSIGIPTSPNEWKSLLEQAIPDIFSALQAGKAASVKGWSIKKIK
jgi:hypothetical protein